MTRPQYDALPFKQDKQYYKPGYYRDRNHPGCVLEIRNFYNQSLKNPTWTILQVKFAELTAE